MITILDADSKSVKYFAKYKFLATDQRGHAFNADNLTCLIAELCKLELKDYPAIDNLETILKNYNRINSLYSCSEIYNAINETGEVDSYILTREGPFLVSRINEIMDNRFVQLLEIRDNAALSTEKFYFGGIEYEAGQHDMLPFIAFDSGVQEDCSFDLKLFVTEQAVKAFNAETKYEMSLSLHDDTLKLLSDTLFAGRQIKTYCFSGSGFPLMKMKNGEGKETHYERGYVFECGGQAISFPTLKNGDRSPERAGLLEFFESVGLLTDYTSDGYISLSNVRRDSKQQNFFRRAIKKAPF